MLVNDYCINIIYFFSLFLSTNNRNISFVIAKKKALASAFTYSSPHNPVVSISPLPVA